MPDVSIIIVAYNHADLLHATLRSVIQHTQSIAYEVIVIDNASADPAIRTLDHTFPMIRLMRNERNAGFAAANNRGIATSCGRYVALLNPDTLLHDDALGTLVRWLDAHPNVGAVGPQLLMEDGQPQPYSYGAAPSPFYLVRRLMAHRRGAYLHDWHGREPQRVDWVAGTCMIVRRAAIEAVGGLDERFFLYFEDVDWGVRLNRAGWPVMFVPTVTITHLGGGSGAASSSEPYDRSLVRFYAKQYGTIAGCGAWLALRVYRRLQRVRRG